MYASGEESQKHVSAADPPVSYSYTEYPLERNGIDLHLDRISVTGSNPDQNILLIHGVTYSSHEFDIDYEDYSLVRFLAREGYAVWRLDIAGFGQSEEVEDGFLYSLADYFASATETNAQLSVNKFVNQKLQSLDTVVN